MDSSATWYPLLMNSAHKSMPISPANRQAPEWLYSLMHRPEAVVAARLDPTANMPEAALKMTGL